MKQSELNKELGEVSAYPTKQEVGQEDVALLQEDHDAARAQEPPQDKDGQE